MIIVFLGPPGSGKGTQAALLATRRSMVHLSTGELLRSARTSGTPLGQEAAAYLDAGQLVPDDLVAGLVTERIDSERGDYLLDGFPRNLSQAERLDALTADTGQVIAAVVLIDVPERELVRRLTGRGRADDDRETIRNRLRVYANETAPLIAHYASRGLLRTVDGQGGVEEIHTRVIHALDAQCGTGS